MSHYTASEWELLHSCSISFLTAPLASQRYSREQMPNLVTTKVRDGRMCMDALDATLMNAGLKYRDLNDRDRKKVLKPLGLWGFANAKRGPKTGEENGKSRVTDCGRCTGIAEGLLARSRKEDEESLNAKDVKCGGWQPVPSSPAIQDAPQHSL